MSALGDRLRSLNLLRLIDTPRLHALADEVETLERELFHALHAPQVSDPYQAGYDMGMRVAAGFQEQAHAARQVSMETVADRDLILDAKMALDLKIERIVQVHARYFDMDRSAYDAAEDIAHEDMWRYDRDFREAMEG